MSRAACFMSMVVILVVGASGNAATTTGSNVSCIRDHSLIQLHARPSVVINRDWLVINNKYYSRNRAQDAWLGRIGRTNGVWRRPVLINFRTSAPQEWLDGNVNISTTVALSSAQSQQIRAAVSAEISSLDANITSNSAHNASYVLKGLTFGNSFKIKHWFNDNKHRQFKQDYMDMYGSLAKPRIVTTAWVIVRGGDEHT